MREGLRGEIAEKIQASFAKALGPKPPVKKTRISPGAVTEGFADFLLLEAVGQQTCL
jgi:hypothetical protein